MVEQSTTEGPKFPDAVVILSEGQDGNAFAILANASRALKRAGASHDDIQAFRKEAMSGDYDNVIQTVMRWCDVH